MLTIDGDAIIYREQPLPLALRLFVFTLGLLLAIVMPAPFVVHADWATPSPMLLLAALFIVLPFAVGAFFILIGLASAAELRLDPATGQASRRLCGPMVNRSDSFPLSGIAPPEVLMRESVDDGSFPILRLRLPNGRRLDIACFSDRAEAERWRDHIARLLAG